MLVAALLAGVWPVLAAGIPIRIWFAPLTHNIKPGGGGLEYTEHDFPALMRPNAPWQTAAARISVLNLEGNVIESFPDRPGLVAFTRSHPWQIAFGLGMMFDGGQCPQRLEGISADADMNREAVRIARLWQQAGGRLDYIIMDSPLWFGHYHDKQCVHSIADVAHRSAATLRGIFASFPNAQIIDAEGPGWIPDAQWLPDMATFLAAIRAETGHAVAGINLDLHWRDLRPGNTWQATTRRSVQYFHGLGVQVGLIVNADGGPGVTDAGWMATNRQHIAEAAQARLGLDYITINQWQRKARLNLPENDPAAYTSLVNDAYRAFGGR